MMKFYSLFLPLFLFMGIKTYCQKKILHTRFITKNIAIDGEINEENWDTDSVAKDFIMFEPDNGKPISEDKKTEIKVLYDNDAIYIAAWLYDNEPNKIRKEVTKRDVFGVSDHFSVYINGFNDGQQDFRFFVSSAGTQMDCLATKDTEDFTWDAIWESKVKLTDFGWIVEMKIPYAALRFSNSEQQTWGLNFMREIKRDAQKYTWNHIDTKIGAVIPQAGILEGIKNIKPPTRLFFIPYSSVYYQENKVASGTTFKAGLDIKYGINDSFTLDAILVPDFGQTKFDNAILNLEPFEQKLNENRPFFTEGTNLFNKGGLFYSRRIGGSPIIEKEVLENELNANQEITHYPITVDLINAIKVSGRTKKGLGIGILNAITQKTDATIFDHNTEKTEKINIQPLTNYNIIVLDQRFNQNSSISFINTNTSRNGGFRDANAAALLFDLNTKSNTYNLYGDFKFSSINTLEDYSGYKTEIGFAKTSGKYRYDFSGKYLSKKYDINDLGINFYSNYHNAFASGSYRIVNPTSIFNTFKLNQYANFEMDNSTGKLQTGAFGTEIKSTTRQNDYLEVLFEFSPFKTFDFYEPRDRENNRYSLIPEKIFAAFNYTTNENDSFSVTLEPSVLKFNEDNRINYGLYLGTKYRFNDKLSLGHTLDYSIRKNDRGWVDTDNTGIIFAERNREIVQNDFIGKYAINNKMTLNLTARHYWSYSENHKFLSLQNNGYLVENNTYNIDKDRNFKSWNFDLSYSWWFAPGSELSILYRNYALEDTNEVVKNFKTNLKDVFNSNLTNIISVSFRYFIDYNTIRK